MNASINRRSSLSILGGATALAWLDSMQCAADGKPAPAMHVATNTYPWRTFAKRDDRAFKRHTDELLADVASTGLNGYEPIIESVAEFAGLGKRLAKHGLEMRSIYVNSVLHHEEQTSASIEQVVAIARAARKLGTKIVVTNPSPIQWGGTEDKSDAQLQLQAKALNRLGSELRKLNVTLAYHNHDAELRQGGREFHHMLTSTDPANVKFCLDAHWIFRGCGDSEIAVFDALAHYHNRVVELHLRQSTGGVWMESFAPQGDIDYRRLMKYVFDKGVTPHLVLEQAVEEASPNKLGVDTAHRLGRTELVKAVPTS